MSLLETILPLYLAGALLTTLAAALFAWKLRPENFQRPGSTRKFLLALLRVFAFWPCYLLLAALLAFHTLRDKSRHP